MNRQYLRLINVHERYGPREDAYEIARVIAEDTPMADELDDGFEDASTFHFKEPNGGGHHWSGETKETV